MSEIERNVSGTADANTILVFGATGQQGGAVVNALLTRKRSVRAFVRDAGSPKAEALAEKGVDLREGDFSDVASIRRAMSGAYGVFSIQPSSGQGAAYGVTDEDEIRFGKAIADIAQDEGVQHLVYTSAAASGKGHTGMGHFDSKTEIENHIRRLALSSTIIRPATFMEMLVLPGMGLEKRTLTFFLRSDQKGQFIAADDIGKIVATIYSEPHRFNGRTIDIAGDEVTGNDLQDAFTAAAGETIVYQRFADKLLKENDFLQRLSDLIDDGRLAGSADIDGLKQEFGSLMTVRQWLAVQGAAPLRRALNAQSAPVALR